MPVVFSTQGQLIAEGTTSVAVTWNANVTREGVFEKPQIHSFEFLETAWQPTLVPTG
jgi:hypothetical protein